MRQLTSSVVLQVSNVAPQKTCYVLVDGLLRGTIVPNRKGRGQLHFTQPFTPGAAGLNFDPRGKEFVVIQNGVAVLRATVSRPGEPAGSVVNELVTIPRAPGAGATAGAESRYRLLADGTRRFTLTLTNVADGDWTLYVNGMKRRTFAVSGGNGGVTLDNVASTPEPALNFDPRGLVIDISRGTALRFSGLFEARANGVNVARPSLVTRFIPGTGVTVSGIARVRRWEERDASEKVDVELVNIPVGDYELFINDVFRGFVPILAGTNGATQGQMQFSSDADDEDERLLNFHPFGSFYVVQSAGTWFFQGQPVADELADTNAPTLMPVKLELPLFNLGVDGDAVAHMQFKRDENGSRHFEVRVKNVPTGDYTISLNGIPADLMRVVKIPSSGTRGIAEFEDEPELNERPLTFDPLGKTVAIQRDGKRYFERTLPITP